MIYRYTYILLVLTKIMHSLSKIEHLQDFDRKDHVTY